MTMDRTKENPSKGASVVICSQALGMIPIVDWRYMWLVLLVTCRIPVMVPMLSPVAGRWKVKHRTH